jgi:glutathione S-transferase
MLKIYGRESSSNVQKVMWAVGELGLEHERIDEKGTFGSIDTPEYRELNPWARIPTLEHDGIVVRQSNTIVRYLCAKYAKDSLWPEDLVERAEAESWMDWQITENAAHMVPVFWNLIRTKPEDRDHDAVDKGVEGLNHDFSILNDHLADRKYVVGEHFTMGDIPPGVSAFRYFNLHIIRPSLPHLEAWYQRLTHREAYRQYVMLPLA